MFSVACFFTVHEHFRRGELTAGIADKPVQRISLKEKLEAYKAQASGAGRADIEKSEKKGKMLNLIPQK